MIEPQPSKYRTLRRNKCEPQRPAALPLLVSASGEVSNGGVASPGSCPDARRMSAVEISSRHSRAIHCTSSQPPAAAAATASQSSAPVGLVELDETSVAAANNKVASQAPQP